MEVDVRWLATQPDQVLQSYIRLSDTISLLNFPANSSVSCDNRQYEQGVIHITGLSPNNLHLVTCSLAAPGTVVALFIPALNSRRAIVYYDDSNTSLSYELAEPIPLKRGDRGIAIQSASARTEWTSLSDQICSKTLSDAQISFGQSAISPMFTKWQRSRPPIGASSAEITKFGMDASQRVIHVLKVRHNGDFSILLGETQLAFLGFLYMGCEDALRHWASVVKELCMCSDMFSSNPEWLQCFVQLFETEIPFLDQDVCTVFEWTGLIQAVKDWWEEFNTNCYSSVIRDWLTLNQGGEIHEEDGPTIV